jgi:hypothetical protein
MEIRDMTSIDRMSVERLADGITDVRRVMLAQADRIEELEAKLANVLHVGQGHNEFLGRD